MPTPVNSSNIAHVDIDGDDLVVTFKNGNSYRYAGAAEHHDSLVGADSPGKYLHAHIKGKHEHKRVGE